MKKLKRLVLTIITLPLWLPVMICLTLVFSMLEFHGNDDLDTED